MPPGKLKDIENGSISPYEYYGALKVLCEEEAEKHWPGRVLHVRAGQLVGPFDYTDRLTFWVQRIAQGGKVLVPGPSNRPVQLIDVHDIATWVFNMAENRIGGTFNVTGPNHQLPIEELLNTCKKITHSDSELVWIEEQFLLKHKVQPWTEMPLWIPEHFPLEGEKEPWKGAFSINIEKAVNAGLTFQPLEDTINDIYQWEQPRQNTDWKAGISREREQKLLEAWYLKEKKEK
ncbi:nucleoside-diphosphate-sugar epimerase [Cytobacillus purgationiresistens]|uniref:Nucleoside-diphosphate-sugar epimerase n=1 Tax=Cytobacillus purgationiresistens TaxID=863449 RepID=A0ABU0ALI8_9BACI|nr:nucleoside-diphosphate-sugar epimerase [Cytobacillus purgationiresistens]